MEDVCYWCHQVITDGKEESGYFYAGPDWMVDGDFGCDENPISEGYGVGDHNTKGEVYAMIKSMNTDEAAEAYRKVKDSLYKEETTVPAQN